MMYPVYELYPNGRIKERYAAHLDKDGNIIDEDKQGFVSVQEPNDMFQPKWDGAKWIEDETREEKTEREAQQLLESLKPTPEELANAELEIKMITILSELGVVQ